MQDRLIISTAIPQITDDFHSYTDIGWYGSAFLFATCAFQLLFGKVYTFYSVKLVFIAMILLFEIGSAICGAAPNSVAFILGRAIAGAGSAGIFSGAVSTLSRDSLVSLSREFSCGAFGKLMEAPLCYRSLSLSTPSRCTTDPSTRAYSAPSLASHPLLARSSAAPSPAPFRGGGASTCWFTPLHAQPPSPVALPNAGLFAVIFPSEPSRSPSFSFSSRIPTEPPPRSLRARS